MVRESLFSSEVKIKANNFEGIEVKEPLKLNNVVFLKPH